MAWDCLHLEVAAECRYWAECDGRPGGGAWLTEWHWRNRGLECERDACRTYYHANRGAICTNKAAVRALREGMGLCNGCGKVPPVEGRKKCGRCLVLAQARNRRWVAVRPVTSGPQRRSRPPQMPRCHWCSRALSKTALESKRCQCCGRGVRRV